ncbi:MAG: ShlB/FhaC/HecB family hemolysin secretion/activation protein [Thermodesulfobacteriota bacterium]
MITIRTKALVLGLALVAVVFAQAAWAGPKVNPASLDPGIVERSLAPHEAPPATQMPEIRIGQDETGKISGGEGVSFALKQVIFDGNQMFSDEELMKVVDRYLGLTVNVAVLEKMAGEITAYYHQNGYILTRAYLPPQTIADGKVIIAVTEGRLGAIVVKGNERYKAETIKAVMQVVREEGALTGKTLERALLLLNDYPGMNVTATLVRGKDPGTTDIVVEVTEAKWWQVGVDFDNFGSEYVSPNRAGVNLSFPNPFGIGDYIGLRYMMGVNPQKKAGPMWYLRGEYNLPVNSYGTRLGVAVSRLDYDVGQELEVLDLEGTSTTASLWASHPFTRTRNFSWWVDGGLDYKGIESKMFRIRLYQEDLYNLRAGTHLEWIDGGRGHNVTVVSLVKGLTDDDVGSRLFSKANFTKFEGSYRRFQWLPLNLTGVISATGQFSFDRVPVSEEFIAGGAGTVRGWGQGDYSGDNGVVGSLEVRYPLFNQGLDWSLPSGSKGAWGLDAAVFTDYGRVWVKDSFPAEQSDASLWGAGLGLRLAWAPYGLAKVEWAKNLKGDKPLDSGADHHGIWYLQLSITY